MATLMFSYSHVDEALRDQLEVQLSMLKRQGLIEPWHDRRIIAGTEFDPAIGAHVETDDIILLLISPDFLASDYCYDKEMVRAMARHNAGEATVIPVILRPCDWHAAPFGKLIATPTDGKAITIWPDRDQAFLEVARAIRKAAEKVNAKVTPPAAPAPTAGISRPPSFSSEPRRSSNLRLAKSFSERDMDQFRVETFEYMAKFFEASLAELSARNSSVEGTFRRVDANRFTAVIYKNGKAEARCTVFMGGLMSRSSINYIPQETTESNSYNESMSVAADDQSMYLRGMGMARLMGNGSDVAKLSQEGASEYYWSLLIEALQRNR